MTAGGSTTTLRHAILIAASEQACPISSVECSSLLPFIDRPILQQCLESAVRCGIKTVDVIATDGLAQIRELLGGGERWGVDLRIHGIADAADLYGVVNTICNNAEHIMNDQILLLDCQQLQPDLCELVQLTSSRNTVWKNAAGTHVAAAVIDCRLLLQWLSESPSPETLAELLTRNEDSIAVVISDPAALCMTPVSQMLLSQRRVLCGEFPVLTQHLKTSEPGVWIGRNTRIHPTARIVAPVFIGSQSDIDEGTEVGPNAVIGSNTILLRNSIAEDCHVMPYSSVGEDLFLKHCLVEPTCIYNSEIDITLRISDDVLISDLRRSSIPAILYKRLSQLTAFLLLCLLTAPALVYRWLLRMSGRSVELTIDAIRLPSAVGQQSATGTAMVYRFRSLALTHPSTSGVAAQWADLWLRIVPGLRAVATGQLKLFGINARTPDEHMEIPSHWSDMIGSGQPGLITESLIQYGPGADSDQRCICDVWMTVTKDRHLLAGLAMRYAMSLLKGPYSGPTKRNKSATDENKTVNQPPVDPVLCASRTCDGKPSDHSKENRTCRA